MKKAIYLLALVLILFSVSGPIAAGARERTDVTDVLRAARDGVSGDYYKNPETGCEGYLIDAAGIFWGDRHDEIFDEIVEMTSYGNAMAITGFFAMYGTENDMTRNVYHEAFGYEDGSAFVIDMDDRYIGIHSEGDNYNAISNSYGNLITANVYSYASGQDYDICALKGLQQMNTVLSGQKVTGPMKIVTNALLAILTALAVTFFAMRALTKKKATADNELLSAAFRKVKITNEHDRHTGTTKKYISSSSGGGHGGGGHGGGGGHSGGGGGHHF